jgi:hypothetical protein
MKLVVLNWFKDFFIKVLGRSIELLFRITLFILPLGLYLLLIQMRDKASKISNISVYTNDDSVWQHVFPGFILVAINPRAFEQSYLEINRKFQTWVSNNKYLLGFLFMLTIVTLMIIIGAK